jgi:hypothetical protein
MEDIDIAAQFQKELREDIERYFEKQARQQQENPKETLFGLFLALLGVILTSGAEYVSGDKETS